MQIEDEIFIVPGGAVGLREATARMLAGEGGRALAADMKVRDDRTVAAEKAAFSCLQSLARQCCSDLRHAG